MLQVGAWQWPRIDADASCCGAGKVNQIYYHPAYFTPAYATFDDKVHDLLIKIKRYTAFGIFHAIINESQKGMEAEAVLLRAGFKKVADKEPNPSHSGQSHISFYIWVRSEAEPWLKEMEKTNPLKEPNKPPETPKVNKPIRPTRFGGNGL